MNAYLLTLAVTLAIELPLALALAPRGQRARTLAVALFANLLTHPLGALLVLFVPGAWAITELLALTLETFAYRSAGRLPARRAVAISIVTNGCTMLVAMMWTPG